MSMKSNNERQQAPDNKPSARGDTDGQVYKYWWAWNGIDRRSSSGCQQDLEKLYGVNEEFIGVFNYITKFYLFSTKAFVDEVIIV